MTLFGRITTDIYEFLCVRLHYLIELFRLYRTFCGGVKGYRLFAVCKDRLVVDSVFYYVDLLVLTCKYLSRCDNIIGYRNNVVISVVSIFKKVFSLVASCLDFGEHIIMHPYRLLTFELTVEQNHLVLISAELNNPVKLCIAV